MTPISPSFYLQDTVQVARRLLGKTLISRTEYGDVIGKIVETEAYLKDDPACHAYRGITQRNQVMFGPPGRAYIYRSYGIHNMLNTVTAAEGVGEAVLIRAASPVDGIEIMRRFREGAASSAGSRLAAGPGRLAEAFGITHALHNGTDITRHDSVLMLADADDIDDSDIVQTTRIGITKGAMSPWRFYIKSSSAVSRR